MDDLEITRRCAEAMGYEIDGTVTFYNEAVWVKSFNGTEGMYNPLHNDAQAMALVKKFHIDIEHTVGGGATARIFKVTGKCKSEKYSYDLNRAICECVAKMLVK